MRQSLQIPLSCLPGRTTLQHSNLPPTVFIPECAWPLAKRECFFKHPVLIENEPSENLFIHPDIAFCHHVSRWTKEIEALYIFSGIQYPDTIPPIMEDSGNRSFPGPCIFSN